MTPNATSFVLYSLSPGQTSPQRIQQGQIRPGWLHHRPCKYLHTCVQHHSGCCRSPRTLRKATEPSLSSQTLPSRDGEEQNADGHLELGLLFDPTGHLFSRSLAFQVLHFDTSVFGGPQTRKASLSSSPPQAFHRATAAPVPDTASFPGLCLTKTTITQGEIVMVGETGPKALPLNLR